MKIVICDSDSLKEIAEHCDTIVLAAGDAMESDGVDGTLNILFTDEEEIRRLNAEYRGQDCVTDVLSFPENELERPICEYEKAPVLETDPLTGEVLLGDVAVCVKRAKDQAAEYGHSLLRELCFLSVHGTLHLMGYDHQRDAEDKKMAEKTEQILYKLGILR